MASSSPRAERAARAGLIALAAFVAFAPALRAGFVFDDRTFLLDSGLLRGPLWRIWLTGIAPDYWPLTWSSLWLEWRAWGEWAPGYHATNVLLHAATGILLWKVLEALEVPGAWFAGLVFVVHPVTVESAAWISERKNTLSAALLFATGLSWIRFVDRQRWRDAAAAGGLFVLTLLAKTSVVLAPVALLAVAAHRRGRLTRRTVAVAGGLAAAGAVAAAVTVWFQRTRPMAMWALPERGALERVGGAAWALATYARQAVLPVNLAFVYPGWPAGPGDVLFYAPLVLLAAVALVAWRLRARGGRAVLLALGFHAIMVFPVLGLVDMAWLKLGPISNHLQYVAVAGPVALLCAWGARAGIRWPRARAIAAAAVVAVLGVSTFGRAAAFTDDLTLWRSAVRQAPDSAVARMELAGLLMGAGDQPAAIAELAEAARVARDPAVRERALAFVALFQGRAEDAVSHARAAAAVRRDPLLDRDLGVLLVQVGRPADAVPVLRPLVAAAPGDADFALWLAAALEATGDLDGAAGTLVAALRVTPGQPPVEERLAAVRLRQGRVGEARASVAAALGVPVGDPRVAARLAELARGQEHP